MTADLCDPLMHRLYFLVSSSHESAMTDHPQEITVQCLLSQNAFSPVMAIYESVIVGLRAAAPFPFGLF